MSRWKLALIAVVSAAFLAGGWLGIAAYTTHAINQNDRGWCQFIQAAQPQKPQEQPRPGAYGDRLLQALNRHGQDIGCTGITPRR